ncbi:hypothetical protein POMI540_3385 [Schizosaccharomyces pombe]|uniref:Conserved oligomeric Golgi complex subunit 4 n=1 Tax=Schizosaccharomyces pombe (strain 972 / ATCC 24843) TaxID=284812 RepID=COG4_SCHPO|nr:putative COG complex subunit Cog4 [Schizosaccharomyces pombe]O74990.1 RecName: Full=Conserved oligomeric Golgi complex subunit 4; Short=COG complex subunit 4; AltName: Full=Component of oligomeric Golgi complex 4 [Schizosaccharomyces pombe 972h-]CAA19344.1 Golgi transport complex subunit Cog4 (predicted) [Schizosaccharomyces pombe]|eukprot:NP_588155.1 putative COG complex subunit Cog4 [Schizosaccharomyces pombe]
MDISINDCTDISQIKQRFHDLQVESQRTDEKLERLLSDAQPTEKFNSLIKNMAERLVLFVGQIEELKDAFCNTTIVSEEVIERIKSVDREQNRIKECLLFVRQVRDFKECLQDLNRAMHHQQWEKAADLVHRASSTSPAIIEGKFAHAVVPTAEQPLAPMDTLKEITESLHTLFWREFHKAARNQDQKEITRYFKLFPLIGKEKEGLEAYWHFFGGIIASKARATLDEPPTHALFFAQAFTGLVEHVASIIRAHTPLVQKYYKAKNTITVIEKLQGDCDRQGSIIVNTMFDVRRIDNLVSSIASYKYILLHAKLKNRAFVSDQKELERVSLQTLHPILNEMSAIVSKWNISKIFISRLVLRLSQSDGTSNDPSVQDNLICASIFNSSKMELLLKKQLLPSLLQLETYYFRRSIETSLELEEYYTKVSPWMSSIVDDVMYVTKQVFQRAFFTVSSLFFTRFVNESLIPILRNDYYVYLSHNLLTVCNIIKAQFQRLKNANSIPAKQVENYITLVNSASLSKQYLKSIVDGVSSRLEEVFAFAKDQKLVKKSIDNFLQLTVNFENLCKTSFNMYFPIFLLPRIEQCIDDSFDGINYVLSYEDYTKETEHERLVVTRLRSVWDRVLLLEQFTPENQLSLRSMACEKAASYIENLILYKIQWNDYGAMALENDISSLITIFSNDQANLRHSFERLQEILILLVWESDSTAPEQLINDLNLQLLSIDIVSAIMEKKANVQGED